MDEDYNAIVDEAEKLKETIRSGREEVCDTNLQTVTASIPSLIRLIMRIRRTLRGHQGKIYDLDWAPDSKRLASAAQDGKILVYDTVTNHMVNCITLESNWVMCCAYSSSDGYIASGGLSNTCSVYDLSKRICKKPSRELNGHGGYVSSCSFLHNDKILTSSGDMTCKLWDISSGKAITTFEGHEGGVMSASLSVDGRSFISGSCDKSIKFWDIRDGECKQTMMDHQNDVNNVEFLPNGHTFASASDDQTCRLFDLRADQELGVYCDDNIVSAATSVAFSKSGRLLFAGYDDCNCHIWDTLKLERASILAGHDNRVNCVGVPAEGKAVATGSWDTTIQIWN